MVDRGEHVAGAGQQGRGYLMGLRQLSLVVVAVVVVDGLPGLVGRQARQSSGRCHSVGTAK